MKKSMKYEDLITVIIPIYRVEKYLERCLNSVINQTYDNLEIILVDDGSPDNCPDMCDNYSKSDNRIKVIHKENGGLSSARNTGIEIATGKYITFVDSDDWLELDAIEILYLKLIETGSDFVMGRNSRDITKNQKDQTYTQKEFLRKLLKIGTQDNVMYAWAKLYKIQLFDKIRYPTGIICEDIPCTFEITLNSQKITILEKVIYNYFQNQEGITNSSFSSKFFDYLIIWDFMLDKAKMHGDSEIIEMVEINKKRADFGVLFNIAIQKDFSALSELYKNQIAEMLGRLKSNFKFLLRQKIPLSRKTLILMFCFNYKYTAHLLGWVYK